ncbi:MAG: hypothetical protein IKY52_08110 [Clostridia bacterium]|nr:hypothetical protein [Clostridia bacterium]
MQFREPIENSRATKTQYRDEMDALIRRREEEMAEVRRIACREIFTNGEFHRQKFCAMLGWPLTETGERTLPAVTSEKLGEEGEYEISRMQIEVLPGFRLTGIFLRYMPEDDRPLVISQHGGLGTPELINGFYDGNTGNYNNMTDRLLPHRVHVFCPQLLLWNMENYGEPYDRKAVDARLKRVGSSITAVEVYAIMRSLDWFAERFPNSPFGMIGLSYGGFYTLFTTAADTRIRSAVSCSFFSQRKDYPWTDWTWTDAAALYDDAEIACLAYPRRLCVQMGDHDNLFAIEHTRQEAARVQDYIREAGVDGDWFDCVVFDGTHELCRDDRYIDRMIADLETGKGNKK